MNSPHLQMFKKYRLDSDFNRDILVMKRIWKRFKLPSDSDLKRNIAPYDDQSEAWCNQHTSFSDSLGTESQAEIVLLLSAKKCSVLSSTTLQSDLNQDQQYKNGLATRPASDS